MGKRGVLVIAHGSKNKDWVHLVDCAVSQAAVDAPLATSFLEYVPGRSVAQGITSLKQQGVTDLAAVPLFVSSGSTHIEEIRHLLGMGGESHKEMIQQAVPGDLVVRLCPAMDDHPLIVEVLAERAGSLSTQPAEEALLLVGHGSDQTGFQERWQAMMESLARQLQAKLGFAAVACATLLPDNVRQQLLALSTRYRVLVVPLFLSEGTFTRNKLPKRLSGAEVLYTGQAYLPSPLIPRWIEAGVQEVWAVKPISPP
jgi:sirohydrochlorin cobaltochelatase